MSILSLNLSETWPKSLINAVCWFFFFVALLLLLLAGFCFCGTSYTDTFKLLRSLMLVGHIWLTAFIVDMFRDYCTSAQLVFGDFAQFSTFKRIYCQWFFWSPVKQKFSPHFKTNVSTHSRTFDDPLTSINFERYLIFHSIWPIDNVSFLTIEPKSVY